MRTLVISVLLWVLLLSLGAGAVLADPGSNNESGRGRGQSENAAQHDTDRNTANSGVGGGNATANGRGQGASGEAVSASPTLVPSGVAPRPCMFSVQGKFVRWVAPIPSVDSGGRPASSAVMELRVISCSRAVREAGLGENDDLLHIVVNDQTRYHVHGGGGGFSTGLVGTNPVGARMHVVGTATYAETATGGITEAPAALFATRVLVQLADDASADSDGG